MTLIPQWQYQIKAEPVLPEELRPETTQPDKYWRPFSEPLFRPRARAYYAAFIASGLSFVPDPSTNEVFPDKWHREFSRPTPSKPALRTALHQSFATDPTTPVPAETVTLDKWFRELDRPTPAKPALRAALRQSFTTDPTIPQPTVDMWFRDLDRPTPAKPSLRRDLRQSYTTDISFPTPTVGSWFRQLETPQRLKRQALQGTAIVPLQVDVVAETVTVDKWLRPLAEPVRKKVIVYAVAPVFAFVGVIEAAPVVTGVPKFEGFRRNVGRMMR